MSQSATLSRELIHLYTDSAMVGNSSARTGLSKQVFARQVTENSKSKLREQSEISRAGP